MSSMVNFCFSFHFPNKIYEIHSLGPSKLFQPFSFKTPLSLYSIHFFKYLPKSIYFSFFHIWPPLLVQRCNYTIAGLGYNLRKYMWFVHANLPIGQLTIVRIFDPHWVEWHNSYMLVNAAPKQASLQTISRSHRHATPKAKLLNAKCTRFNTNLWNWPPNI